MQSRFTKIQLFKESVNVSEAYATMAQIDYLTLQATELGYDTTIMAGINFKEMTAYLSKHHLLVANERVLLAVAIGTADETSPVNQFLKTHKTRITIDELVTIVK